MTRKVKVLSTFIACIAVLLMAFSGTAAAAGKKATITEGEAAYAAWQVQNLMSKHCYYHAAGMHIEELNEIWVDADGPNAATATFASPNWIMVGISGIMKYYGQVNQDNKTSELEAIASAYPEVENTPENLGIGHEWAMHTNTTPVIEVAGDGKTAKGIWYSPGMGLSARAQGENVSVGSTFFWEKYGADFIKENGVWKMWHCQMWYDFTPSLPSSMTANLGKGEASENTMMGGPPQGGGQAGGPQGAPPQGGGQAGAPPQQGGDEHNGMEAGTKMSSSGSADMIDNPGNNYQTWSPTRMPSIEPRFPEPYYTFSETFSY